MKSPMVQFPTVTGYWVEFVTSVRRIQGFLLSEEIDRSSIIRENPNDAEHSIKLNNASFSWDTKVPKPTLANINISVQKGSISSRIIFQEV